MYDTLILSGNSTNAVVTLGALQHVIDKKWLKNITTYIGTSSGAMLGLLLIIGYEPIDILSYICAEKIYKKINTINFSNMLLLGKGIMSFEPIKSSLEDLILEKIGFIPTMEQIEQIFNKRMFIVTYNLSDDSKEYISTQTYPNLLITHAIRMSSTFPLIFEPYEYNGKFYIDGGIVDNFALEFGELIGNNCIGIFTNNPGKKYKSDSGNIDYIQKIFSIVIKQITLDKIQRATNTKIIKLDYHANFFNFESTNTELISMFDTGYNLV